MPTDATPDLYTDPIRFGQRLQILRTRRELTREQLGGLMGRSASWVKGIETGRRGVPRYEVILHLAELLRVRDLSDLTGDHTPPVDMFAGPGHPRLGEVRAAVDAFPLGRAESAAPGPGHLAARLAHAWSARHNSPTHREVIGALLPDLIRDAQATVRAADTASDRRAAQAVLSEVYSLSQFFLAYQPDAPLLWRVAERGMIAAQESEDPHTIGVAAWLTGQAHRDSGHFEAADHVTDEALRYLSPLLPDATDDVRAITGALTFESGYTAARRKEKSAAWARWKAAQAMSKSLPAEYFHPVTSFSRAIMGAHAVTIAVELHSGPESVRQAAAADAAAIPSRPRRARHRIEQARGYQLDGQPDVALATLEQAHGAAPETIRYNGYAKRIILEEAESKVPDRRRRASELAVKLGLLTA